MRRKSKSELKQLLKKLQTLAERGVGGEKVTAQKKLEKLLKESGLTENDLKIDEPQYYLFRYQGEHKKKLLSQCIYKTVGADNFRIFHTKGTRNKIGAYCTPAQKVEIELDFEFYSAIFDQEVDAFLTAFIAKQDIYPKDVPYTLLDPSELTQDQLEKWKKIEGYKNSIDKKKRASGLIEDKKQ